MLCLILLALTSITVLAAQETPFDFSHSLVLDSEGKFDVFWKPDFESKWITFEVQVQTLGWVGLGLGPKGSMAGADFVVGWVADDGRITISDRYATENGFPMEDETHNYDLLEASKNDTHTRIRFTRLFKTCDEKDWVINEDTVRMLWAYDDTLPLGPNDLVKHKSSNRGSRSVQLLLEQRTNRFNAIKNEANIRKMDLMLTNVQLPNQHHTLYWCKIFKMPPTPKHHLIGYEMVISPGHQKYVHHMILYQCTIDMSPYANSEGQPCYSGVSSDISVNPMKDCGEQFVAAWAVGGEPYAYPDKVGLPVFGNPKAQYFMMEMHYDNSDYIQNVIDNSGIRLYLTQNLRPIEAGSLTLGAPPNPTGQIIPPRQRKFTSFSYCSSQCTKDMPTEGHTVFSGFLHTHLIGTAVRVRHIREGKELKPLFKDDHYDFNYQNFMIKRKPTKILPGDEFIVECEYDSSHRMDATLGGPSTADEMCLAFMEFYPRDPHGYSYLCMSSPDAKDTFTYLGALGSVSKQRSIHTGYVIDKMGRYRDVDEFIRNDVNWNPYERYGLSKQFQRFVKNSKHMQLCYFGREFQAINIYGSPIIYEPYAPLDHCFLTQSNDTVFTQLALAVKDIIG